MKRKFSWSLKTTFGCILLIFASCVKSKKEKQVALFNSYCASCHIAPALDALPKHLWANEVLPNMGARMGIQDSIYHPYKDLPFNQQEIIYKTGVYPIRPIIAQEDWQLIKEYIISMAPDSMPPSPPKKATKILSQFDQKPLALDSINGSTISFMKYQKDTNTLVTGTVQGALSTFDFETQTATAIDYYGSPISDYTKKGELSYFTGIGRLHPSEIPMGKIFKKEGANSIPIAENLHRPVHTLVHDFNKDGKNEIVISEFGDLTGKLSLFIEEGNVYRKEVLLRQPGVIKLEAKDMNSDGKDDLVAITSQGDESITILYQQNDLNFAAEKVIRFSPIYGSSWFEMVDYDNDGDQDIITVHGDNADQTYIHKPYHGMRIHINDGDNNFEEKHFYAMNGATRILARDFDQDGDIDFALISTFVDYEKFSEASFVYLENTDAENFVFQAFTLEDPHMGRWFLMDAGDVDDDGDDDIIVSSLTYPFSSVPDELNKRWHENNIDILVLYNKLKTN